MSDEVKRKSGRKPKIAGEMKVRSITTRLRDSVVPKLEAAAANRGHSLSEEIERRVAASFDAEALETMLRRVVRQEVERALDMPITPGPVTIAAMEQARSGEGMQRFETVDALMADLHADDALVVMADAQH